MIKINGFENRFIVDLNINPVHEYEFTVVSLDNDNNDLSWGIELISLDEISVVKHSGDKLSISLDANTLSRDGFILLRNYNKERLRVDILHNEELSRKKEYYFEIINKNVDGKKIVIDVISKEELRDTPWTCTYDGKPLSYSIIPSHSNKSGKIEIESLSSIYEPFETVIEFTQDKSNKVITLNLIQDKDSVTIKKTD